MASASTSASASTKPLSGRPVARPDQPDLPKRRRPAQTDGETRTRAETETETETEPRPKPRPRPKLSATGIAPSQSNCSWAQLSGPRRAISADNKASCIRVPNLAASDSDSNSDSDSDSNSDLKTRILQMIDSGGFLAAQRAAGRQACASHGAAGSYLASCVVAAYLAPARSPVAGRSVSVSFAVRLRFRFRAQSSEL